MCSPTSGAAPAEATTTYIPFPDDVPIDTVSQSAFTYASKHLQPAILNHSMRVFLYAQAIATRENSPWNSVTKLPLFFSACILHDIGTISLHNGPLRFEVEGADAASNLLCQHDVPQADAHEVWVAIALHTSPHIAERISPLARFVRLGVLIDFKRPDSLGMTTSAEIELLEERFPRLNIEKVLGDAVTEQAVECPKKAPAASWPGVMYRWKLENPEWDGMNQAF
jgi:hypothetical protein